MNWKAVIAGVLLLLPLGWTFVWERRGHADNARQLASLLAPEVVANGEKSALWRRMKILPGLTGGELLSSQRHIVSHFGSLTDDFLECSMNDSGELVGYLRISYQPSNQVGLFWVSWLTSAGLLTLLYRSRPSRVLTPRGSRFVSPAKSRTVMIELDGEQRVVRAQGDVNNMLGASAIEGGKALSDSMIGKLVHRVSSQTASTSLVVVRDSEAWSNLQNRVRELSQHYHNLCDLANDFIIVSHPEGLLIFANKKTLNFFPNIKDGGDIWSMFQPEYREVAQQSFRDCIMEGVAKPLEAFLSAPQGKALFVRGSFCPGMVESGVPVTVLGIFRDLTEQVQAEEGLRQAQKMEAVGRLAAGVAHDFNNLLTILSSVSSLIRSDLTDASEISANLDILDETVQRGAELTRQLLLSTRHKTLECAPLDVDTTLGDICKLARHLLGDDVSLQTDLRSLSWILADRSELEQVAMNLLVNARDAMPKGGLLEVSSCRCEWSGHPAVQMRFRDSGCGMSSALLQRIFDPYFTTKEQGKGTGLGLSTSYAIVARLHGNVEVLSKPGQGTTFIIHLPTIPSPLVESVQICAPTENAKGEHVLLVEDEESLCKATGKKLRQLGYEVTSWVTPLEALAWLERSGQRPDILVTDVVMPGIAGPELARRARVIRPELKVLFVSGYVGDHARELEGLDFLPKPYVVGEMHRRIQEILMAAPCFNFLPGQGGHDGVYEGAGRMA